MSWVGDHFARYVMVPFSVQYPTKSILSTGWRKDLIHKGYCKRELSNMPSSFEPNPKRPSLNFLTSTERLRRCPLHKFRKQLATQMISLLSDCTHHVRLTAQLVRLLIIAFCVRPAELSKSAAASDVE